jgi:hypothetical protein
MTNFLAFFVPKLGKGNPSISIRWPIRSTGMSCVLALQNSWIEEARKDKWGITNIFNGNGPKER